MILQALTKLYEDLAAQGKEIPVFGYSSVAVSAILQIDMFGNLIAILPANTEEPKKKASVIMPMQQKRSGKNAPPYFICDNAQYVLGIEKNSVTEKSKNAFASFKEFHKKMFQTASIPEVTAFLNFLDRWDPEKEIDNDKISNAQSYLNGGLIFRILEASSFLHEIPEIKEIWNRYYLQEKDDIYGTCLVTGTLQPIARIHNSVKGIRSDSLSPNGWTLVGFDKSAFCSYGKEQSYNAPVGKYAAFAYTSALNYLLADRDNVQHIGDTTIVCWAEGAEPQYQGVFFASLFDNNAPEGLTDNDLRSVVKRLADGLPCDELALDPNRPFYILGLAPNAARLSVRFFLRDTFGNLMKNVNAHHERMEIVHAPHEFPTIPLWAMLRETVNMNSRDKSPSSVMAGAAARAIFSGSLYPASLLEATMLRIRAERDITRGRAAIIKAYYLKNENPMVPKEVLQVSLNEQSTNVPYTLGRLFSVLEDIQQRANPGINATIKDKYFNSAASNPATIFPLLNNLCEKHLRKLETGQRIYYEKQLFVVMGILNENYPAHLTLPEQGSFYLGYYHQTQKRYEKKGE